MQILIVDDERTARVLHAAYVRKLAGFDAVCFGTPRDALDWAATHQPAIVIVDYLMPVIDGIEFTRQFRRLPGRQSTPVFMVTDSGDVNVRQLARSAGVNEFLNKPVDRIQLSACILNLSTASATRQQPVTAPDQPTNYGAIDAGALATIFAARDRLRALAADDIEAEPDNTQQVAVESALSRPSDDILILDDERTSITMLDHYVRKLKCYPARFAHPAAALEWCETHQPLAAIVDYMMPDMDGLEFTRRFRLLPGNADTPVLLVSAYGDALLQDASLAAGVNEFLHKPVDAAALTAHLRGILAARELETRLAKRERLSR